MAVNTSSRQESLSLYNFLCEQIVGTEETVRIKRMMNTIRDNVSSDEDIAFITSGSFGEGLEMKDSDTDLMVVFKQYIVHEKTENVEFDPGKVNIIMEMDDTKPGFTLLRYDNLDEVDSAVSMGKCSSSEALYLSSELIKAIALKELDDSVLSKFHGPCLSDENEEVDVAFCFHNPKWIQPAQNWIKRGSQSWPSIDVKSDIIDHGVLLVPTGCKGSANEALEWRISFSVPEKLLVYSFCHTQLLCYALMKILLKDCINRDSNCKDLLCSYFIKTIIFWVVEETRVNECKPENLIRCFMKCFKMLLYYVEYSVCPHYFIPTINLFESKIDGQDRKLLLGHLKTLFSFGWRCVLFSKQFQSFEIHSNISQRSIDIQKTQHQCLLTSKIVGVNFLFDGLNSLQCYKKCFLQLKRSNSSFIKSIYLRYLSIICKHDLIQSAHTNKNNYYQYNKQQSYLFQNVNHDAGSGWLVLAALFYYMKHYSKALYLLNHTLTKCTPEIVYFGGSLSLLQVNLDAPTCLKKLGIMRSLKNRVMFPVTFDHDSRMLPEEIEIIDVLQNDILSIPPVVFAHFLCFLCHYHLNDIQQCNNSIKNLQRTIDGNYFIASRSEKQQSYDLLGCALQLVGRNYFSSRAFRNATQCGTYFYVGSQLLPMI